MINLLIIHFFFSGIESSFILQSKKSKNEKPFIIIQAANTYIIQNRNKKLSFYLLLRVDGAELLTEHRKTYKNKV